MITDEQRKHKRAISLKSYWKNRDRIRAERQIRFQLLTRAERDVINARAKARRAALTPEQRQRENAIAIRTRDIERYRQYHRAYAIRKRRESVKCRIAEVLRARLRNSLKGEAKAQTTMNLLGCSIESLKLYLESKFEPGMSWENYGTHGWHIDHIIPCALFDLSKPEHQKYCFHFSNLQPLWAKANHRKYNKVLIQQLPDILLAT